MAESRSQELALVTQSDTSVTIGQGEVPVLVADITGGSVNAGAVTSVVAQAINFLRSGSLKAQILVSVNPQSAISRQRVREFDTLVQTVVGSHKKHTKSLRSPSSTGRRIRKFTN